MPVRHLEDMARTQGAVNYPLSLDNFLKPQPWLADALCAEVDPEIFFPEKGGSSHEAKDTCKRCPVSFECLKDALDNEERFGIWGGLSERERRKLQKKRGKRQRERGTAA